MWVFLYRENGCRRYETLGPHHKLTKAQAEAKRDEVLIELKARQAETPDQNITFGDFTEGVALPFLRTKWKKSTASTTENRIRYHLLSEFGDRKLSGLGLKMLQDFLNAKAPKFSKSVVAHLRWDLSSIVKIAVAEGHIERDPTAALYIPKARVAVSRILTKEEVEQYLSVLDVRESVIAHLAIFVGMRPGEILALQRRHVSDDCTSIEIEQRLYRGDIDTPKTESSTRTVAIPPQTAVMLREWMELVGRQPKAWLFNSENPKKPMWRDNVWYRNMQPKLKEIGLDWANFLVLRRTHASLGHEAGIDPKVSADQRGHGIGVAMDVYTKSSLEARRNAAAKLQASILKPQTENAETDSTESDAVKPRKNDPEAA
jgi:integrase